MEFPKNLRIATINQWPYFELNETSGAIIHSRIEGKLISLLAEKLKFQFTLHLPRDGGKWGNKNESGDWSGIIGMFVRDEVDIAVAHLSIREDIYEVVDFSAPYYSNDKTFAMDIPGPAPKYAAFLSPFRIETWIIIFFSMVVFPNLMQLRIFRKCFDDFCSFAPKTKSAEIKNSAKFQALKGSWLISSTLLKYFYTSVLLSFLTVELKQREIRTTSELATEMATGKYQCLLLKGNIITNFLLRSSLAHFRTIGAELKKNSIPYSPALYQNKPFGNSILAITPRSLFQMAYGTTKYISEDSFVVFSTGILFKKGFCCRNILDSVLLRIVSAGIYQKLIHDEVSRQDITLKSLLPHRESVQKLGFDALSGVFYFLVLTHIVSLIILLLEIAYYRRSKKNIQQ
ncbi:lig_chan-Glu_bd domain-containing protein [Trichonephila clavata]|uniref:Lig_chan-Glu_bd domain-containing protein n=1 Tax=Trichonephila clavata TaxID=2740835 RepID=A0A8X6HJG3_TRICU|nr:lig_chan-Glu_bd domain-containing protein [Trichonephila clavata]